MLTLLCNVLLTRRQEMCFVVGADDVLRWSGKEVYEAVQYIINTGQTAFILDPGDDQEKLLLTARKA